MPFYGFAGKEFLITRMRHFTGDLVKRPGFFDLRWCRIKNSKLVGEGIFVFCLFTLFQLIKVMPEMYAFYSFNISAVIVG